MMKHATVLSLVCLSLLTLLARPTHAQLNTEQQLSDEFVRSGVAFMGYAAITETDAPQVLAATLLDAALELNPKNAQAWAMRVELAEQAGDTEAFEKAMKGYLATGIRDDRASFKLIQYRIAQAPTLDGQMQKLEELLNSEAGRKLAGPLRSRVAALASSIAAELLDEQAKRRWAVEAARSDPGNAEAARMMRDLVIQLGGDNVRIGTATVNIIRADPLNPAPRIDLASILAEEAAFERAAQQYQVVATRLSQQPLPMPAYLSWAQSMAMIGQDAQALQFIDQFESAIKGVAPGQAAAPATTGEDGAAPQPTEAGDAPPATDQPDAPKPVDLPVHFELIRLAVLDGEDDKPAAQAVFDRIAERLREGDLDKDAQAVDLAPQSQNTSRHIGLIAAVFAPDLDQAEQLAGAIQEDAAGKDVALGWVALRRGDNAKAETLLRPHANQEKLANVGLAMVLGQDEAGRARLLSAAIQKSPGSMAALAAGRAMLAAGETPAPTAAGKTLTTLMGRSSSSFWLVDVERFPWLEVRLKINPQRIKPMQPVVAEVTVWNTARFPIAIGENAPVKPSAMILISATSSGLPMAPNPPLIVDIGKRYTLEPGERYVFDTRIDYHRFGLLRASNPGLPLVFDARLLVNPVITGAGTWLPNGIGGVSEVRNCLIESRPATEADVDTWLTELNSSNGTQRLNALNRLTWLNKVTQPEVARPAVLDRVRNALIDIWENGSDAERAYIVCSANQLSKESTSYPELYELAGKSDSKLVWLALLARQVNDGESDILRTAISRQDLPEVSRFAERQRKLLREFADYQAEQERIRREQQRLNAPQEGIGGGSLLPVEPTNR